MHDSHFQSRSYLSGLKFPLFLSAGAAGWGRGPNGAARRQAGQRTSSPALRGPAGIVLARRARTENFALCGDRILPQKSPSVRTSGMATGLSPPDRYT